MSNGHKMENHQSTYSTDFMKIPHTKPLSILFLLLLLYTISLEESTGNNGDKCLERIGLEGELRKVFVSNHSTEKITFQGTRAELNDLTSINRPELLKEIEKLKLIEGNFSHLR